MRATEAASTAPERLGHRGVAGRVAAGGQHLVEQRERVAHPALGLAGDQGQRRAGERVIPSAAATSREPVDDLLQREAAEVVALAAREDGVRQLVRLGGGEDELHVRRAAPPAS